jgi:mono/diheme cytochrome c family protein
MAAVDRLARHLLAAVVTATMVGGAGCGQDVEQSAGERGERAYRANCAACHADDLGGTSLGPTLLGPDASSLTDAELRDVIRNGVEDSGGEFGAMPGNSVLRDAQVTEIIAFVRSQQALTGD